MADYREFSAKTVDDCITDACMTFSVTSDRLDYEVVEEGSSGFIGIGAKNAVINARVKEESFTEIEEKRAEETAVEKAAAKEEKEKKEAEKAAAKEAEKKANEERVNKLREMNVLEEHDEEEIRANKKRDREERDAKRGRGRRDFSKKKEEEVVVESKPSKPVKPVSEEDQVRLIAEAEKFLTDLFAAMKIETKITCTFDSEYTLNVELEGEEMGLLIGKRGQTLDSVQYLTSLVVNKGMEDYVRVKVDIEDYRKRRKDTLEKLAKNIAFKVKRNRRSVTLEPMNPYERRIIHSALQNDRYVTTHSEGEEPYRKVVVTLKNNY